MSSRFRRSDLARSRQNSEQRVLRCFTRMDGRGVEQGNRRVGSPNKQRDFSTAGNDGVRTLLDQPDSIAGASLCMVFVQSTSFAECSPPSLALMVSLMMR